MTKQTIALATFPASLLLMLLAYLWPTSSPTLSGWTEEASKQHGEVAHKLHELTYGVHSHGPPKPGEKESAEEEQHRKQELEEYKKKFAEGEARLERSRQTGTSIATMLTYISVLVFGVGIAGVVYQTVVEQQQQQGK